MSGPTGERLLLHLEPTEPARLPPIFSLSRTQRRVADLAGAGLTIREMAEELGSSTNTVRTHLRAIYAYLGVSSRVELASALEGRHAEDVGS